MEELNGKILLVDDESNILTSLRRLLRSPGLEIFMATSGQEGLDILEQNDIDLVISDMRMPEMNGAEFLAKVYEIYPETVRILLTGYSDMDSAIDAINKGKISTYLNKPWQDEHLKLCVNDAFERKQLRAQKKQLMQELEAKNKELSSFNKALEKKVAERTEKLNKTLVMLQNSMSKLKQNYGDMLTLFSRLVDLIENDKQKFLINVAETARQFSQFLNLDLQTQQQIYQACLLLHLGHIALPRQLTQQPLHSLSQEQQLQIQQIPLLADTALTGIVSLQDVAKLVRYFREQVDGQGYPDKLVAEAIPQGSQVISIVYDFFAIQQGKIFADKFTFKEACQYLLDNSDIKYMRNLVESFVDFIKNSAEQKVQKEVKINIHGLKEGMQLSRDLVSPTGILLIPKATRINQRMIDNVIRIQENMQHQFLLYVIP